VFTPFPGTPLHEQLVREDRITNRDWSRYTMGHVVYQPQNMTAAELYEGRLNAYARSYSRRSILKRMLVRPRRKSKWLLRLAVNLSYRRLMRGGSISGAIPGEPARLAAPRPVSVRPGAVWAK
jgi:radical SAM superfamily enzyme YgiQ (UPF0313 family)